MRDKLHANIDEARKSSEEALKRVEVETPADKIIRARKTVFDANNDGKLVAQYKVEENQIVKVVEEEIHPWALTQITEYAHMPKQFFDRLMGMMTVTKKSTAWETEVRDRWGMRLACHNLTQIMEHQPESEQRLIRSVGTQTRGFLSTKYKRRHPGMLVDGFVQACQRFDLLPYAVNTTDTRIMMRGVLDGIIEPVPNECLGIGVIFSESPYGNGSTSISIYMERMWCTNGAVLQAGLRSAHVGGRLDDDFAWSHETYIADTQATVAQIADLMAAYVSPRSLRRLGEGVKLAHETKIEPKGYENFLKKHLSKEDSEAVVDIYRSADVEMLPAGNTRWRASNALSFFAGKVQDQDKRFDLQKLAGAMLEDSFKELDKKGKK